MVDDYIKQSTASVDDYILKCLIMAGIIYSDFNIKKKKTNQSIKNNSNLFTSFQLKVPFRCYFLTLPTNVTFQAWVGEKLLSNASQ